MLNTGLILSFFTGFILLNSISYRFSLMEKLGLSFLLGIASQTFLMVVLDAVNISLTVTNIFIATAVLILALSVRLWLKRQEIVAEYSQIGQKITATACRLNLVWLIFVALIAYFEYMNYAKCMFFPTFDRDSLAAFDTIGKMIAHEHTLHGLAFVPEGRTDGAGYLAYMPMIQFAYAYVYMLGAEMSKIIPALVYLSFLVSFYAVIVRFSGHTAAAIATFFMMITPEMIAFSSLSATNVIHAVYASLGMIYTVLWLKNREKSTGVLAMLLTAFGLYVRNESVVFVGAAILLLAFYYWKRDLKSLILYAVVALLPIVFWTIYINVYQMQSGSMFIMHPFWDASKAEVIWTYFKMLVSNKQYYGLSFIVFAVVFVLNIYAIIKRKDKAEMPILIVLSALFYMILLYQIDYRWDTIENVLSYSAKRFMFCFIPLLWMYSLTNYYSALLFGKLDKVLSWKI